MAEKYPYKLIVEGPWDPKTPETKLKNKLTIYFQSKKSSDGGDCVFGHIADGRKAIIQFKHEKDRQRVLHKQKHELNIDGKKSVNITVSLPPSEVPDPGESTSLINKLATAPLLHSSDLDINKRKAESCSVLDLKKPRLRGELKSEEEKKTEPTEEKEDTTCRPAVIENIQNSSQEFLTMLVENVLKGTSAESDDFIIEVIPESNCAVVTFSRTKDMENFLMSSSSNAILKKKNMTVRLLEMTSKVKAEGLPPNANADLLMIYFDKFGEVEDDLVILEKEQSAIITFKDSRDVDPVIKKQHSIKKHPIRVLPYYKTLQTALYGKNRPSLKLPEAFIENIDHNIWHHLNKNQTSQDLITQAMSDSFCKLDFQSPAVSITPLPSILQQGGQTRKLIQTWGETTSSVFSVSLSRFKSFELNVQKDAWSEVETKIHEAVAEVPVTLIPKVDQGTMAVAGLKEDVTAVENILREIVERVTQRIQREKGSEADEIDISPSIYKIIFCDDLKQQFHNKFPELEITYQEYKQKLTFYGLRNEVLETKNTFLQDFVNLIRRPVELHQSVFDFLYNEDLEDMNTALFFHEGIYVALELEGQRLLLTGKTEKALMDGGKQLKTQLGHLSIDVEDAGVLRRSDWQQLVSNIKNTESRVLVRTDVNQVLVSGFVDVIKDIEKQLRNFIHENSNTEKTLKAHKTIIKFIKDFQTQDWFEEVNGKVIVRFQDDTILISGPKVHVSQYVPMFEKLLFSSHHCIMSIAKPGAKKLSKEKESVYVPLAKTNFGCLVQLMDEYDRHDAVKSKRKALYQFKTPDGVEITVNKEDMCSFQVDAIVSASNEALHLDGGLAKALSSADANLQDACNQLVKRRKLTLSDAVVLNAGGRLRCKHVIFALAPQYSSAKPEVVSLLKKTVRRSLNLADQENCQSVAIPAIGSGGFSFPLDLCADTIVKAIKEFCDIVGGDSVLRRIHLVDSDDQTVQALEAAVQNIYGVSTVDPSMTTTDSSSNQQQDQNQASSSQSQVHRTASISSLHPLSGASQSAQTKEGLTITLMKGNIEDTTMDVVVNTLSSDLNLGVGAVSNALLKAAGTELQALLHQQATAPANSGSVIVTGGAKLKNKLVFHAVVPHYNQGQGNEQKILQNIIDECLSQAEQRQQKSIVFSAIGTGNLKFPRDVVTCLMMESVLKFSSKRKSKNVQEVVFALHPSDAQTIQAFTAEFNKKFMTQSAPANSQTLQKIPGPFTKVWGVSGVYETKVGGVKLQVLSGDVTAEKTDVIVNSSNKDFTLKAGVSKAVLDKAGPIVEDEAKQLGSQPNNGLIVTQAGNLQCKKIIHISAQSNSINIQKLVRKALEKCAKEKFTSISLPAIGTGQAGLFPGQVADAMMDAVVDMVGQTPKSSLKLIRIVVFQAPMLNEFYKSMQNREYTIKQQKESTLSKIKTYVKSFIGTWGTEIEQSGGKDFVIEGIKADPAYFSICGPTPADVDKTKKFLEKMISDDQTCQSITDTAILSFSDKDKQQIQDMQSRLDVSIKLQYKADKGEAMLTIEGVTRDVLRAIQEIQDMIKRSKEEEILKRDMDYVGERVEWQYEQGGQYINFDQQTNFKLEKAYSDGATDTRIFIQGQEYQIKLPEGPAVSINGGNQIRIRRIDRLKATESIPQNWDAMSSSELLKIFTLQPANTEFNEVSGLFKATCPNNNILKIERIQNPGMWKNYQNNKSVMEKKNGHQNNEKRLFHGTAEQTISHINRCGFNRSYAGKNAAAFGRGTYFAANAQYSAGNTYSVPNAQGQKHMYLCRVLTGDYTQGNVGMIVPPPKNTTTCDLYDTVVDNPTAPTIFVVFRDDHAYPEYLITFT